MTHYTNGKLRAEFWIFSVLLILAQALRAAPADSKCDGEITVQILTDRTIYAPGAMMHVRFLITNTGESPLNLFRRIGQCSSPYGRLSVSLHDMQNRDLKYWLCAADDFLIGTRDIVKILANTESGIFLQRGEIYGRDEDYDLPKQKGTYWLKAELAPSSLTEDQNQALVAHHIRTIRGTCTTSAVRIVIK